MVDEKKKGEPIFAGRKTTSRWVFNDKTNNYEKEEQVEDIFITIDPITEPLSDRYTEEEGKELYETGEHKLRHLQQESLKKMFKFVFGI